MKKKTILGVGLTLMLLGSLLAAAAPVSAGTLSWTTETLPLTSTFQIAESTDVTDIAVYDEDIIFAGSGAALYYKSTDGGATWASTDPTSDNDTDLIAVAPDDEDLIVYADTTLLQVWLTTNGGSTFGSLGSPTNCGNITDISISAEKVGTHYIGVAGNDNGDAAEVWYYNYGAASPAWVETADLTDFSDNATAGSAAAVAFSPNFASDEVMVALVVSDNVSIKVEMYSFDSSTWNANAGFTDWEATVVTDDGITGLTNGSITLDPDYLGSDDAMRMVFVGLDIAGDTDAVANSGIYRVDDTLVKAIKEGSTVDIKSVAYNGLNLVAGEDGSTTTYYCADPTATTPTVSPTSTYKRVGGQTAVVVAWAGDNVVAGTTGDESAFSVSSNDGKSYNDISLIDTNLLNLRDVAVSSDGGTVFMTTDNGTTNLSVWRKASSWERVLSVQDKENFIIRLAPDDSEVVYIAEKGSTRRCVVAEISQIGGFHPRW